MSSFVTRRAFFGALTGLAAAAPVSARPTAARDLAWFGAFALGDDSPLRLPNNYLNTFRDVYHAEPPDVNVAVGIAGAAFPVNASDTLWEKYRLGDVWKINGEDGKPATRNIYLGGGAGGSGATVRALAARGVVFWQCAIALGGVASRLARETGVAAEKIRADLAAGLNPGVKIVPAHSMAVGLVQERGFTYMRP
jgi:intracellular sulfur oxidation DsrE/DsrF family protein